uniref:Uncharacterized protein n=1 Tax=Roseihalotalea indica TaxID=2867963 RepID=A0AA49JIE2_9BACT|nr:hypothetical protein K4G66_19710 [Tunicatimonas sp. TK19036]
MKDTLARMIALVLTVFISLTSIGGGVAILVGLDEFPAAWLEGTLFPDYTIPALILVTVVGGSSFLATILLVKKSNLMGLVAIFSGVMMMGYISAEVLILKQETLGPTLIEVFYFVLGLLIIGLGIYIRKTHKSHPTVKSTPEQTEG